MEITELLRLKNESNLSLEIVCFHFKVVNFSEDPSKYVT